MTQQQLIDQCRGLHEEMEAMGATELRLTKEREELIKRLDQIDNTLQTIRFNKVEYKKLIELNLNQQEAFWDLEQSQEIEMKLEDLSPLEHYLLDPNSSIQSIADQHGISNTTLSTMISEHLKVA